MNDGSKDDSDLVIRSHLKVLCETLENVVYVSRENRGLPATLNELLGLSKGCYIKILASDDYLHAESIEPFVGCMEGAGYDIVFGDLLVVGENGDFLCRRKGLLGLDERYRIEDFSICDSLRESPTVGSAWLMRASSMRRVGGFDPNSPVEDWEFVNRLTISGIRFFYLENVAAYYRTFAYKGPYGGSHRRWLAADLYILNKFRSYCEDSYRFGVRNVYKRRLAGAAREGKQDVLPIILMALRSRPIPWAALHPMMLVLALMPSSWQAGIGRWKRRIRKALEILRRGMHG